MLQLACIRRVDSFDLVQPAVQRASDVGKLSHHSVACNLATVVVPNDDCCRVRSSIFSDIIIQHKRALNDPVQ
jgi:hypothetical protein